MADPLSAISLGIRVAQGFVHYVRSFRGYDREIDAFVSSVERLKINLQLTRDYIENPASQFDAEAKLMREQLERNVSDISAAIAKLQHELQRLQPDKTRSGVKNTIKKFGRQAAWHFRKDSLPRLQTTVSDILGNLELGINNHQLVQIGFIRQAISEIQTGKFWPLGESSTIIETLRKKVQTEAGTKVVYFYFQYNDNVNGSAEMVARSLIYQLSFTSKYCAKELEHLYEACQVRREAPSFDELITVVLELVQSFGGTFVILDALDEAPDPDCLWQVLKALSTTKVHLFLACRPNVDIRPEIQTLQPRRIYINPSKVEGDIRAVVKARLNSDEKLRLFSESHLKIESSLMEQAGGIKIDSEDLDDSIRILTWLCFSQRPLRVDELVDALAVPDDWISGFDLANTRLKDAHALLDLGSGLVESDQSLAPGNEMFKETTVRLAHASVKEWLQSEKASSIPSDRLPFVESEGHWLPSDHRGVPLAYAAEYPLDPLVKHMLCEHGVDANSSEPWKAPLEVAVTQGQTSIVKTLIEHGANVSTPLLDSVHNSVLSLACNGGSLDLVKLLCDNRALDAVSGCSYLPSALAKSASLESDAITRLLLDRGVPIDCRYGNRNRTALHRAADLLRLSNIKVLLQHAAKSDLTDSEGNTALHLAVQQVACTSEIATLLGFSDAQSIVNSNGETPFTASIFGNESVCKMIVRTTPDLHMAKPEMSRALIKAAAKGFLVVVDILHQRGAEFAEGEDFALIGAASNEHEAVVKYLLDQGQTANIADLEGLTPFLYAVKNGHRKVWELLADAGCELNALDLYGRNACYLMVARSDDEGLEWLLERGVDFKMADANGVTALHLATAQGQFRILKILLERDTNIPASNNEGAPDCHEPAANDHLETSERFSEQDLITNAVDKDGSTPFLKAVQHGHLDCVEFLSMRTQDFGTRRLADGCTALGLAVEDGHIDVVRWILEKNININEQFQIGDSPNEIGMCALRSALDGSNFTMTEFLLENGADPNLSTRHGTTPVLLAAEHLSLAFLTLLVDHGARIQNVQDNDGDDIFLLAVSNPDEEVLRWVIDQNLGHTAMNNNGLSPVLTAAMFDRVGHMQLLRDAGLTKYIMEPSVDNAIGENDIRNTSIWYAFRSLKTRYQRLDMHGRYTPLMVSAFKGHLEVVKYLLTQYPDMQKGVDKDGNDALTYACCAGYLDVVEHLIENDFDAGRVNMAGRSAQEETEQCLQKLEEDHSTGEYVADAADFVAFISSVDGVLYYLRDLDGQSSDGRQEQKTAVERHESAFKDAGKEVDVDNKAYPDDAHREGTKICPITD
ncbi:MAG: hypothetical protein Q9160_000960 [Pyrenula sp. 1 TL-2023]